METFDIGMFKRTASANLKSYADLQKSKVAVIESNIGEKILKNRNYPKENLLVLSNHEEALFKLLSGEVDAFVFPAPVVHKMLYDLGLEDRIEQFGESLREVKRAIRVRKDLPELARKLNSALVEFLKSERYQEIYTKYYGKPTPYWTVKRVLITVALLSILVITLMLYWRYRSLRKLNHELAESREQYRELVEGTSDLVVQVDGEGRITYVNGASKEVWGVEPKESIGRVAFELIYPEDREQTERDLQQWIEEKRHSVNYQNRQIHTDGKIRYLLWTISLHYDTEGGIERINSIARDITKQIELEAEAEAQKNIIIEQSKNAAIGQMIGVIAHQWKQPVNEIGLIVQNLVDAYEFGELDEKSLKADTDQVMHLIDYMTETIQDFRDFLKPSREKSIFMACEMCVEIGVLLKPQFKRHNIEFVIHEHEHFKVLGFPNEFKQALMNILVNARDAIEEHNLKKGLIDINFENDGENGIIYIRDNAGGIPENLLPNRVFESYITTKGEKGTGIGLNICRVIIEEKMGGELRVHNVEGGAEFVIKLPLVSS